MPDTLWFDADQRATFLLPSEAELPEGELWLRTFDGRLRSFEAGAVEPYRVGEAEARQHVKAWVERGFSRARDAFARGYGDDAPVPPSLEAALGVDPARFASDPEAFVEAARHLGGKVQKWIDEEAPPETAEPLRKASAALAELLGAIAQRGAAEE